MKRTMVAVAIVLGMACGGGGGGTDGTGGNDAPGTPGGDSVGPEDVPAEGTPVEAAESKFGPDQSWYDLTLEVEEGDGIKCAAGTRQQCFGGKTCCRLRYERDLTGLPTKFSFGSTHIAPAISFAMTDTMYTPSFTIITLNFGIIIGTSDKPPSTPTSGEYEFGGFEPEVVVTIFDRKFGSKIEGSAGLFDITDWSAEEGGVWAGTVEGTIVQDTAKAQKLAAAVKGSYHFILPKPQGGQ